MQTVQLRSRIGSLIYIDGRTPSKKNSRINTRSGRSFPSKKYMEWHKLAAAQVAQASYFIRGFWLARTIGGLPKIKRIHAHFFFPDLLRADLTNKAESIMDLLVDCRVLADDSWRVVRDIRLTGTLRRNNPGCLVRIV